jgi:alpha-beta hydrolase superfamily lysophospholipase
MKEQRSMRIYYSKRSGGVFINCYSHKLYGGHGANTVCREANQCAIVKNGNNNESHQRLTISKEAMMLYQKDAPGDWGQAQETAEIAVATEHIAMDDGCKLFLRSWTTRSTDVLLILHGLGGHGGWYIDMANVLASRGLTVYTLDLRGFGRSTGLKGHVDSYQTLVEDSAAVIREIRKRHPDARIYLLGHSMGGIIATYVAARYSNLLAGVLYLNPWVEEAATMPIGKSLAIFAGGLLKSRRHWQVAGGHEGMTTNQEAYVMLQTDSHWQRTQTATFLVQIVLMRLGMLKQAKQIGLPTLVMQAEADQVVQVSGSSKLYIALASSDKTWHTYPNYQHDSQFEAVRLLMDNDIVGWIHDRGVTTSNNVVQKSETHTSK